MLLNMGNGSFYLAQNLTSGSNPYHILAADFNSDGTIDLATANRGASSISVLLNEDEVVFRTPIPYKPGSYPVFLSATDVNKNDKPYVVTVNSKSNDITLFNNTC